jgi:hypothetical protein
MKKVMDQMNPQTTEFAEVVEEPTVKKTNFFTMLKD